MTAPAGLSPQDAGGCDRQWVRSLLLPGVLLVTLTLAPPPAAAFFSATSAAATRPTMHARRLAGRPLRLAAALTPTAAPAALPRGLRRPSSAAHDRPASPKLGTHAATALMLSLGALCSTLLWRRLPAPRVLHMAALQASAPSDPPATGDRPAALTPEVTAEPFVFDHCADCVRSWDKAGTGPTDEAWRLPEDRHRDCGEDSFVRGPTLLAVADGVGGWQEIGVDPSLFANALMKHVARHAALGVRHPRALMAAAYADTVKEVDRGSATCLIAALTPSGILVSANMGDCGLRVLRGNACVHATTEMVTGFNSPFQLTTELSIARFMGPANCQVAEFQTEPGDVVLLASDGLLDNLTTKQILEVVEACRGTKRPLAEALKARAVEVSHDSAADSPFALNARRAGFWYSGGKPDDITVVVGTVQRRP